MIDGLFVVGTSRPAGKTLLCRSLAFNLRQQGLKVGVMKPVDTGCQLLEGVDGPLTVGGMQGQQDRLALEALKRLSELAGPPPATLSGPTPAESLESADARALMQAADFSGDPALVNLYRFAPLVEPAVAARLASVQIDLDHIVAARDQLRQTTDLLLVEANACVMTPLSEHQTQLDLIQRLGYPVLLMGPSCRGVVDAALLSLEVLRSRKIPVAGVVFNRQKSELSPEEASYPYQVEQFFGPLVRGVLPHFDAQQLADLEQLSSRLQVHVDLCSILQRG